MKNMHDGIKEYPMLAKSDKKTSSPQQCLRRKIIRKLWLLFQLNHTLYNLDLTSCDYIIFRFLKEFLLGYFVVYLTMLSGAQTLQHQMIE